MTTTRPPAVRFTARDKSAVLTVGGFRVAITPTGDEVADLAFSGLGAPGALHRLGIELRCASVRWGNDGFIFDALRSRDHEPGMADGDVLARVGCANDDPGRVLVALAMASDPYVDAEVEIASMPDGCFALTSEPAGFEPAMMGAIGSILEAVWRSGVVGCLLTTVRDAARDCGCEDLDAALTEMAEDEDA
jgi:hypothetical protein